MLVISEKNQNCSKLPEMARKLAENDFWWVSNKNGFKNGKVNFVPNCLKCRENWSKWSEKMFTIFLKK